MIKAHFLGTIPIYISGKWLSMEWQRNGKVEKAFLSITNCAAESNDVKKMQKIEGCYHEASDF